jgi:hypothetical protein
LKLALCIVKHYVDDGVENLMPRPKPSPTPKALRDFLHKPGMQAALAKKLKIARQAVGEWATGQRAVPLGRIIAVEAFTGIPREQIRPDIYKLLLKQKPKKTA